MVQIRAAFVAAGQPEYWNPGIIKIATGPYASAIPGVTKVFIPMSDDDKLTLMRGNMRLNDTPLYAALAAQFGGEEARVNVDPADFWQPEELDN